MAPPYLGPFVRLADLPSRRALRSANSRLVVPTFKRSTVGGRTFQVFLDRGCGTSCLKTLQRRRHCQSSGVDWRLTSSRNHILIFWFDISVDTVSGPCSDASHLGHFEHRWTEMKWNELWVTTINYNCSASSQHTPAAGTDSQINLNTSKLYAKQSTESLVTTRRERTNRRTKIPRRHVRTS